MCSTGGARHGCSLTLRRRRLLTPERPQVLISRDFRGDTPASCVDRFVDLITDAELESELKPVVQHEGLTFTYITHNSLYLLAVSRANVNAVAVLYFLHRLVDVFKHYFEAR